MRKSTVYVVCRCDICDSKEIFGDAVERSPEEAGWKTKDGKTDTCPSCTRAASSLEVASGQPSQRPYGMANRRVAEGAD